MFSNSEEYLHLSVSETSGYSDYIAKENITVIQASKTLQSTHEKPTHSSDCSVFPLTVNNILQNRNSEWEKKLTAFLRSLWETETLCDVSLQCFEGRLRAHQVVLAANSERLANVFKKTRQNNGEPVLDLRKVDSQTVHQVLQFLYDPNITVTIINVTNVLKCSTYLRLSPLVRKCLIFLSRWNANNALRIYEICTCCRVTSFSRQIWNFVCANFEAVIKSQDFLETSIISILTLFSEDQLAISSEDVVLDAAIRWLQHDKRRLPLAPAVLDTVRLALLHPDDLVELEENKFLQLLPDFHERLYRAMKYHGLRGINSPSACKYACRPRKHHFSAKITSKVTTRPSSQFLIPGSVIEETNSSPCKMPKRRSVETNAQNSTGQLEDLLDRFLASLVEGHNGLKIKKENSDCSSIKKEKSDASCQYSTKHRASTKPQSSASSQVRQLLNTEYYTSNEMHTPQPQHHTENTSTSERSNVYNNRNRMTSNIEPIDFYQLNFYVCYFLVIYYISVAFYSKVLDLVIQ